MKITLLLTFFTLFHAVGSVFPQNALTLSMKNASIQEVLNKIEDQSKFKFFYQNEQIDVNRKVNVEAVNAKVEDILSSIFTTGNVKYRIFENNLVVLTVEGKAQLQISGTVISLTDGLPIPGVNVLEKGTTVGTVTNVEGKYNLTISKPDAILIFSYVGYKAQEIPVNGQQVIDIKLVEDIANLNEVIVVGYGTQKKSDLTGAVSSINRKDMGDRAVASLDQLIQGNAPGVSVTSSSGLPGGGTSILIRGAGTINNTQPLYVIDGVPFRDEFSLNNSPLSLINPNDIESIEILKDASTSAIYGSSGANGVILISTKKGKVGKTKVSFDGYLGWTKEPSNRYDLLNASQYTDLVIDLVTPTLKTGETMLAKFSDPKIVRVNRTNWQDKIFRTGRLQDYNLNISGGSEIAKYNVGIGYSDMDGNIINYNYKRYTARINTEYQLGKYITVGENLTVGYSKRTRLLENNFNTNIFLSALRMPPYLEVTDPNNLGGFSQTTSTSDYNDCYNPVAIIKTRDDLENNLRIIGNTFADVKLMEGLIFRTSIGLDLIRTNGDNWQKEHFNAGLSFPFQLTENGLWQNEYTWDNTLTFSKQIRNHSITALAGSTVSESKGNNFRTVGTGYSGDAIRTLSAATSVSGISNILQDKSFGYFGRLSYSYKNRYLLQGNIRADASSRFNPNNKWGTFPAFSAGWKISEEPFFKVSFINFLKLRGGWGQSGNDKIPQYAYFFNISDRARYPFGADGARAKGSTVLSLPSEDIVWETTTTSNIGFDAGLLHNKLQFNADFFMKKTKNVLLEVPVSSSLGYGISDGGQGNPVINAGDIENKGVELNLTYQNRDHALQYSINGNISFINGKVTSLGSGQPISNAKFDYFGNSITRTEKDAPIGYFYGWVVDKVYSTQNQVDVDNTAARTKLNDPTAYYQSASTVMGDIRFKDLDGNGIVDDKDRTNIGDPTPDFYYGFTINVWYKGFDLSLNFTGVQGNEIFNANRYWTEGMTRPFNSDVKTLSRWKKSGDITSIPRAVSGDPNNNTRVSDRWVEDGSYLRCKTLTLGYTLNADALKKYSFNTLSKLRVYFSAQNLFTLTNYSGYDPEIGSFLNNDGTSTGYNMQRGIDFGQFPTPRNFIFGVQVEF
jgi:TonB-linked SusC/RagA family outer membrane protein